MDDAKTDNQDWDAETPAASNEATVRVRCIVKTMPHTHDRALKHGDEADVPKSIARLMLDKKQVEKVKA